VWLWWHMYQWLLPKPDVTREHGFSHQNETFYSHTYTCPQKLDSRLWRPYEKRTKVLFSYILSLCQVLRWVKEWYIHDMTKRRELAFRTTHTTQWRSNIAERRRVMTKNNIDHAFSLLRACFATWQTEKAEAYYIHCNLERKLKNDLLAVIIITLVFPS